MASCQKPSRLTEAELKQYLLEEDNGLRKVREIGDVRVEVVYQPTDLMIRREVAEVVPTDSAITFLRKKYEGNHYFILSLSKNGKEILHQVDPFEYGNLVRIMSFEIADYVFLTNSIDTLHVSDYMLDRTFGLALSTNMLFAFQNKDFGMQGEFEFVIGEFGLGLGKLEFEFEEEDISSAPQLIW